MFLEQAPSYGAVSGGKGLGANYSLNFTADLTHQIPLTGAWQGDSVKALSLFINNYENNFSLTVTGGNSSKLIPAYSTGYLDISSFDSVTITSSGAATVTISVLNYVLPYGFDARGNPPDVSNNDPLISQTGFIGHYDGINNGVNFLNSKNNQLYSFSNGTTLSTIQKRYGDTSAKIISTSHDDGVLNPSVAMVSSAQTYEISVYPEVQTLSNSKIILLSIQDNTFTNSVRMLGFASDAAGLITDIFIGYCSSAALVKQFSYTLSLPKNEWSILAFVFVDASNGYIYLNGKYLTSFSACGMIGTPASFCICNDNTIAPNNPTAKSFVGFVDEVRITNTFRYLSQTYDTGSTPFLNQ
jgi:hypothetical protein